jgi:hypothetical protein
MISFEDQFIKNPFVGPNNLYTKIPWDILRRKTPKFRGMCRYYFSAPPNIFHNFVSFHPILMFLTILESGDKTNNIGDEFKARIFTYRYLGSFYSFSDMKTYF